MPSEYSAFLEEGERVDHVIKALAGMNRWMALLLAAIIGLGVSLLLSSFGFGPIVGVLVLLIVFTRLYARRLILVTDRAVVLLAGSRFTFKPTALLDRLPVDTPLGPAPGTVAAAAARRAQALRERPLDPHRVQGRDRTSRRRAALAAYASGAEVGIGEGPPPFLGNKRATNGPFAT